MSSNKSFEPKCITTDKWDPLANDYSQPRPNKLGGKNIYVNNTQIRSNLVLQTPLMRTWGISVYVDEKGEQQGGYSLSLVFDREGYATPEATEFQKKVQQFEDEIVKKAFDNRLAWFGDDDLSLDTIRRGFYPVLKYPAMKDDKGNKLKKKDLTKTPTFKIRVPNYDGKWQCSVFDSNLQPLYVPGPSTDSSPIDYVPKNSQIITKIKCDGIWTGSANISWGIKWNLQVCVVQPFDKPVRADPYSASDMDVSKFSGLVLPVGVVSPPAQVASSTQVEDSDEEEESVQPPEPVVEAAVVKEEAAVVEQAVEAPKKKVVKKVVK